MCAEFYINNVVLWAQPLIEAAAEAILRYYLNIPLFDCGSVIKAYTYCYKTTMHEPFHFCTNTDYLLNVCYNKT